MKKMTWEEAVEWLRQQPDKQEIVRACFFDDPLLDAAQRYQESAEWQAVRTLLPKVPGTVLDVGAGRGIASFALAEDNWKVTALEADSSNLVGIGAIKTLARVSKHPFHLVRGWGEKLPFVDASFDVVHVRQVLHHARDLGQFCAELGRVLKPGGLLIATREHVIDIPEELEYFRANHALHALYGGECAFTLDHYLSALTGGGRLYMRQVITPFQSPINFFPYTDNDILGLAREKWPWGYTMGLEAMLSQLDHTQAAPGRLYTFIAYRPLSNNETNSEALMSRIVVLEARLQAQKISVEKRCSTTLHKAEIRIHANETQIHANEIQIAELERNIAIRFFKKIAGIFQRIKLMFHGYIV